MNTKLLIASCALVSLVLGCELIVDFDRANIAQPGSDAAAPVTGQDSGSIGPDSGVASDGGLNSGTDAANADAASADAGSPDTGADASDGS
jgi:hypothetical protein